MTAMAPRPVTAVHGLVLHVPYPPAELSPNARVHYQRLARVKAKYRAECAWATKEALGKLYAAWQRLELPAPPIPLRLDFHPATARTRDDDNLVAAFKAGRDGLAEAIRVDDALFETTYRLHPADRRIPNPIVLTGDIHSNWVNDLRVDDRKPETPIIATEFVGTSITSGGNGRDNPEATAKLQAMNPCVRFFNRERGYVRCTVTPKSWRSDYVAVEDILKPGGRTTIRQSFLVESGRPGAQAV